MQWVRLEQKFKEDVIDNYTLADTYTLSYRARYNFYCAIPLSKRGLKANTLAVALVMNCMCIMHRICQIIYSTRIVFFLGLVMR